MTEQAVIRMGTGGTKIANPDAKAIVATDKRVDPMPPTARERAEMRMGKRSKDDGISGTSEEGS